VLAVQLKLIWLDDAAVAVSPLGAEGAAVQPVELVVALAWFDAPDDPAESTLSTR